MSISTCKECLGPFMKCMDNSDYCRVCADKKRHTETMKSLSDIAKERDALRVELAAAKKLAMDLICENQGLKHKTDKMQEIDHYPRNAP